MASLLDNLLAGLQTAGVLPQTEGSGGTIDVVGRPQRPSDAEMDEGPRNLSNRSYIEEALNASENAPQRKGMFGVKGTLRDILGLVGDAFLVQSGNKPIYRPQRQMEREADALAGFTQDPLAAFERLGNVNPEAALKGLDDYQQNLYRQGQLQSLSSSREALTADRQAKMIQQARNYAARLLGGVTDPSQLPYALDQINRIAQASGTTLEELGLGADITPEQAQLYSRGDMSVYQQENLPLRRRQVATGERNAATAERNAARPPAPRNPTPTSLLQSIMAKDPSQRTQEEQNYVEKMTTPTGSSSKRYGAAVRGPTPVKTTGKLRIRDGKIVRE